MAKYRLGSCICGCEVCIIVVKLSCPFQYVPRLDLELTCLADDGYNSSASLHKASSDYFTGPSERQRFDQMSGSGTGVSAQQGARQAGSNERKRIALGSMCVKGTNVSIYTRTTMPLERMCLYGNAHQASQISDQKHYPYRRLY